MLQLYSLRYLMQTPLLLYTSWVEIGVVAWGRQTVPTHA